MEDESTVDLDIRDIQPPRRHGCVDHHGGIIPVVFGVSVIAMLAVVAAAAGHVAVAVVVVVVGWRIPIIVGGPQGFGGVVLLSQLDFGEVSQGGKARMLFGDLGSELVEFDQPVGNIIAEVGETGQGIHGSGWWENDASGGGEGGDGLADVEVYAKQQRVDWYGRLESAINDRQDMKTGLRVGSVGAWESGRLGGRRWEWNWVVGNGQIWKRGGGMQRQCNVLLPLDAYARGGGDWD